MKRGLFWVLIFGVLLGFANCGVDGVEALAFKGLLIGLPFLVSVAAHESAHAFVAALCGDRTAADLNRISLDPLRHFDFVGMLVVPAIFVGLGLSPFGYAKPVPFDESKLDSRTKLFAFAAAGPLANFLLAAVFFGLGFVASGDGDIPYALRAVSVVGMNLNLAMGAFNLIPFPPLDGGKCAACLLPARARRAVLEAEPWLFLVLLFGLQMGWVRSAVAAIAAAFNFHA